MTFEICADSYASAILAKEYNVKRIELCSALSVGGLTPSFGLIKKCVALEGAEVHAMIRHKEGGFIYDSEDLEIMKSDILGAKAAGAAGVVFGCLTSHNTIDVSANKMLLETAKTLGLEVTCHRAFDFVDDYNTALNDIIDLGFDRLLTSGGAPTAIKGISVLTELVTKSRNKIQIMAGSGVSVESAIPLSEAGVDALHFTVHRRIVTEKDLGMGFENESDIEKLVGIKSLF